MTVYFTLPRKLFVLLKIPDKYLLPRSIADFTYSVGALGLFIALLGYELVRLS